MKNNIIDSHKQINITRADYERARDEYERSCMFMANPPSFQAWLASQQEYRNEEN